MRERTLNRDILRLAVPALGSLIAEPVFLAIDAGMVGHLGVEPLASLGVASTILTTIVGLMVFLAYSTTPQVARRLGSGDLKGAVSVGIDSMWLALGIGALIAIAGSFLAGPLVAAFGPEPSVADGATQYLKISMWGLPAMLIVFAATGLLRGLQNTVLPLWIAVAGFAVNTLLNALFIFGLGWGLVGSAVGTVLAQWGMVAAYVAVTARLAKQHTAAIRPHRAGVRGSAKAGAWLLLRTLGLRVAILATVWVATALGTEELAGWQIVVTVFNLAAFALDALAIAAQALIGKALGAGNQHEVREVLRSTVTWGVGAGGVLAVVIGALSWVLGLVFTGSWDVARFVTPAFIVLAVSQPIGAYVFVLDGVLMGAGDGRYLALASALNLVPYAPVLVVLALLAPSGPAALAWLAAGFYGVYMLARAATLSYRIRGSAWMDVPAQR
ncbi:MAG: MATE family efflux transporter [Microbacterium sp.]